MRGQAHTLEGFVASLIVIGSVVFALQATAVTPLTASTSNQHIENQQGATASNLLATAAANDTLEATITYWDRSSGAFVGTGDRGYYTDGGPPTAFGAALNRTYSDQRIAFNVHVVSRRADDTRQSKRLVYMGTPSDNAVSASRTTVVRNDTALSGDNGTVAEAAAAGEFYAVDVAPGSELFNVMEVRIVVWRI
jgi:hypothetical protein